MTEKDLKTDIDDRQNHRVYLSNECRRIATGVAKKSRGLRTIREIHS